MRKAILLTTLLLGASGTAAAADNGIYLGASLGQTNLEVNDLAGIREADFDGSDLGFKLTAGIRPLDWLAVEASYVNFGKPDDTVLGTQLKADGDGISAFAVGFLTLGPVDVFAKGGLISWDSKITGGPSNDGTDLAYGLGAQFRLLGLSVRAEYEIFDVSEVDDLNMLSIGLTYTFL
jgi:Outer membrane protein beta-barrel domain